MKSIDITITSDFICPWCWIGHANLKAGIERAGVGGRAVISYRPFELNPQMPKEGINRKEYRSRKFGSWARSQAMDAEVTLAGKRVGLEFNYDRVHVTPNTRMAHRLMHYAVAHGDTERTEKLFDAIPHAYFSLGRDIGSLDVLADIAASLGYDPVQVREYLCSTQGEADVVAQELQAQLDGVQSVPTILIGNRIVSGAQPPEVIERVLQAALAETESA